MADDEVSKIATVIIPNYNGINYLKGCLRSLERQTIADFQIIVVDNGSTDGSIEFVRSYFPEVRLMENGANLGFSAAVNLGVAAADTPLVILLNNDTVVSGTFVEELVKASLADQRIFAAQAQMVTGKKPFVIDSLGDGYTILGWTYARGKGRNSRSAKRISGAPLFARVRGGLGAGRVFGVKSTNSTGRADGVNGTNSADGVNSKNSTARADRANGAADSRRRIFSACAGAAIYRKAILEEIGGFDEMHFAYLEDIDVAYRANLHGYYSVYCPQAKVYHYGSAASGSQYNSFKAFLTARNNIFVIVKNMPIWQIIFNFPALFGGTLVKWGFYQSKGLGKDYARGLWEGVRHSRYLRKVAISEKSAWRLQGELIRGTLELIWDKSFR